MFHRKARRTAKINEAIGGQLRGTTFRRSGAGTLGALLLASTNSTLAHGAGGGPVPQTSFLQPHQNHSNPSYANLFQNPLIPSSNSHSQNLHLQSLHSLNLSAINVPAPNTSFAHSTYLPFSGHSFPSAGLDLNLNSTTNNIVLGASAPRRSQSPEKNGCFSSTFLINVEWLEAVRIFADERSVTAAEYVASSASTMGHSQSIVLDGQGAAVGGTFSLNQVETNKVGELVVPANVTALDNFSRNSSLGITGQLINYGDIYGLSTNSRITSGLISAGDITNEAGGLISTTLPSSIVATVSPSGHLDSGVGLSLIAANDISNSGTISSAGALTLTATNGSISNIPGYVFPKPNPGGPVPDFVIRTNPVIQAVGNVNLYAGNGNVTNGGLIASKRGDINIDGAFRPSSWSSAGNGSSSGSDSVDININGAGGTFQAQQGNINVRNAAYDGANNITMQGGDYLSQNLNLYSGTGAITGQIGNVTGVLNTHAGVEHLFANSENLALGNNKVLGDPTFATTGNIQIQGVKYLWRRCVDFGRRQYHIRQCRINCR